MAETLIEHVYRLKGGEQIAVEYENPMLDRREPVIVYCADGITRMKIGDGVHRYNELPFLEGVGLETLEVGEIFNDYENNQAINQYTHSEGSASISGVKGFKIDLEKTFKDLENKKLSVDDEISIYFTEEHYIIDNNTDLLQKLNEYFNLNKLSIQLDSIIPEVNDTSYYIKYYYNFGEITSILNNGDSTLTFCGFKVKILKEFSYEPNWDKNNPSFKDTTYIWLPNIPNPEYFNPVAWQYGMSHAEGDRTKANGESSHSEGRETIADGKYSHAEGRETYAGYASHAEGRKTRAIGEQAHAEGNNTLALGYNTHTEGSNTKALSDNSHAEGHYTVASSSHSHAEGVRNTANGVAAHVEGGLYLSSGAGGNYANGDGSHAEGSGTYSGGKVSHTEGKDTKANGIAAHAEGYSTNALGNYSHVEGTNVVASGNSAHAEGKNTDPGYFTENAYAESSHTEGTNSRAYAKNSHVGGDSSKAGVKDSPNTAQNAFVHGSSLTATRYKNQVVFGNNNLEEDNAIFMIGNGYWGNLESGGGGNIKKNAVVVKQSNPNCNSYSPTKAYMEVESQGTTDKSVVIKKTLDDKVTELSNKISQIDATPLKFKLICDYSATPLKNKTLNITTFADGTPLKCNDLIMVLDCFVATGSEYGSPLFIKLNNEDEYPSIFGILNEAFNGNLIDPEGNYHPLNYGTETNTDMRAATLSISYFNGIMIHNKTDRMFITGTTYQSFNDEYITSINIPAEGYLVAFKLYGR